jgi:hypothetical protein
MKILECKSKKEKKKRKKLPMKTTRGFKNPLTSIV